VKVIISDGAKSLQEQLKTMTDDELYQLMQEQEKLVTDATD
jgi:hypothetical protein